MSLDITESKNSSPHAEQEIVLSQSTIINMNNIKVVKCSNDSITIAPTMVEKTAIVYIHSIKYGRVDIYCWDTGNWMKLVECYGKYEYSTRTRRELEVKLGNKITLINMYAYIISIQSDSYHVGIKPTSEEGVVIKNMAALL